jgi:Cytochrome P460
MSELTDTSPGQSCLRGDGTATRIAGSGDVQGGRALPPGVVPRHDRGVPARIVAIVTVVALAASAVVVAVASTTANGLPAYTNGYQKWPKLNRTPFTRCGPPCAHGGTKNVYASKRRVGRKFPNGTVVVKTIVRPGTRFVGQFAVMRKVNGHWRYVEYQRASVRAAYAVLAQGQLCQGCHLQAKSTDYVFTTR